jgi:hypothetical protein
MAAVAWVLALFGLVALLLAISRLVAGRRVAAAADLGLSALLFVTSSVVGLVAADLGSYQPRVGDRPIADLYVEQVATRRYRLTLTRLPGGRMQVFELSGDAWRIDARTIDFGGWVSAIGGRPAYRLDRLVALTRVAKDAASNATTGYALDTREGLDLWQAARRSNRWREVLHAGYASSEELPLTAKSRFELRITSGRIDVRPAPTMAVASDQPR